MVYVKGSAMMRIARGANAGYPTRSGFSSLYPIPRIV